MLGLEESVDAARKALREAASNDANDRGRPAIKAKLIATLRDDIILLRNKQWSWQAIADVLKDSVDASPDTIRLAMTAGSKAKKKTTQSRPKVEHSISKPAHAVADSEQQKRFGPPEL